MPRVRFLPDETWIDVEENAKILAVATRNKVPIRFGCGACRCGTCGVAVDGDDAFELSDIKEEEMAMLKRLGLATDGSVRMACRARVMSGDCEVDLDFQDTYDPPNDF